MAAKKGTRNPLTRVPKKTLAARHTMSRSGVVEQPTPHAQPVGEVLKTLQAQAKDGMPGLIFDDGTTTETSPLMKRMRSEIGTAEVSAKRRGSALQASVAIEVRCDRNEDGDAGRYQVRADGHVACETKGGRVEAKIIPVSIDVDDVDGSLKLDSEEMRGEIVNAIRSTDELIGRKLPQ